MTQTITREIAATPDAVWAVVSDITRIGEWSPECYRCEWDADQEPGIGATFTGYNHVGEKEWSNQCTIVDWTAPQQVSWEVRLTGRTREIFGGDAVTRWGFKIEATSGGSLLTQTADDMRPEKLKAAGDAFLTEIPDRSIRNIETMQATVAAIAAACE